jgi:UDP-N-acetylmuramate dehydrogenase
MTPGGPTHDHYWRRLADRLQSAIGGVQFAHPLSRLTTLRIGGPARIVAQVQNIETARRFLDFCHAVDGPWRCLGGGSNILADDRGYAGMIMLVRTRQFTMQGDAVRVGSGWKVDDLVLETLKNGLTGLEFAGGLPGTIGGAVVGNAGCYGREIGSLMIEATVLRRDGRLVTLGPEDFAFGYRTSSLKNGGDVVLEVVLALSRGDTARAARIRDAHLADRRRKHPWDQPSAGSYFKNLPPSEPGERRQAAGALLEAAGAKQMREGGAAVFPGHANIIINAGGATSRDVLLLADRMRTAVQRMFDVDLEPEVVHLTGPEADPCSSSG